MQRARYVLFSLLALAGCPAEPSGSNPSGSASGARPPPTGVVATAKLPATGAATGATPTASAAAVPIGYDRSAIKPIADDCKSAGVVIATAPKTVGADYGWPFVRQAMYANRQFNVFTEEGGMGGPMTLRFRHYEDPRTGAFTLVAECEDGKTCNDLAAMIKAIVRSSSPQPFCGPPTLKGKRSIAHVHPLGSWLPDDTIGKCARIAACRIASDRSTPGDPGLECQKSPTSFKLECAKQEPCSSVVACLGK